MENNPFLAMLGNAQQTPQEGAPQGGGMMQGGGEDGGMMGSAMAQAMQGAGKSKMQIPAEQQNPLEPGITATNTKPLLGALSSINQYLAGSTSPEKVKIARQIMLLLSQLINVEEQNAPVDAPQQGDQTEGLTNPY